MTNKKLPTLQEQLEAIKKRAGQPINSNPAVTAQKQVDNYKTRIAATGKDPEELTDKRNIIEKALRLPENQNAIFDVLELLGRPSKALFSGANAVVDNVQGGKRSIGQAMLEGLSGESKDSLKTVLQNITNSNLGDNEDKWDWIDTLDLAGEIFLDPVDWALIPVTGGASIAADAAKLGGKAADAAKIVNAADDVVDAAKTGLKMKSASDLLFQGVYKGIGAGVKGTDNLISKTLKKVSEDDYYRLYNGLKSDINRMFTQGGRAFKGVLRASDAAVEMAQKAITPKLSRISDLVRETTEKYGKNLTEEQVSKNLYDLVEYMETDLNIPVKMNIKDLIKDMVERGKNGMGMNQRTIPYSQETYRVLKEAFESTGLGKVEDFIQIRKGTEGLDYIAFTDTFLDPKNMIGDIKASKALTNAIKNSDDIEVPVLRNLTQKDISRINRMKQDPIMMEAAKKYIGIQDEVYQVISSVAQIPVETLKKWSKNSDWRIAHTANDILTTEARQQLAKLDKRMMDVFGGKYSVLKSRKYNMGALEVNTMMRDQFIMAAAAGELADIPEELESAARVFYGTDMFTRDVRKAFDFFGTAQTESIIRNDALQKILLMAADESLDDPQLWRKKWGEGIPKHMTEVTKETGAKLGVRLRTMAEIYGDKKLAPKLMALASDLESGDAVIAKGLLQLINRNTSREFTNNVFEVLSRFNNVYKAGKTLSPMFNITNLSGNLFNMAMSGMKFTEIPKYYGAAHDLVKRIPDLMDKASRGLIQAGSDDEVMFKIVQEFINEGILGPSGELAPLGIANKLKDMDTMAKYAGKENYNYIDNMAKIHDDDGSFKAKYGFSVREIYDHMTQKISDAANPMDEAVSQAQKIVKDREITLDKLNINFKNNVVQTVKDNPELREIVRNTDKPMSKLIQDKNLEKWVKSNPDLDVDEVLGSLEDIWYETRLEAGKASLKPMQMSSAKAIIADGIKQSDYDGWFRNADSAYKERIIQAVLDDPEMYNASMNIMLHNYNEVMKTNLTLDEFLETEITLYRGAPVGKTKIDKDLFTSYSLKKDIAEKFVKGGSLEEIKVKPKDTLGMLRDVGEMEVLVPEKKFMELNKRPTKKSLDTGIFKTPTTTKEVTQRIPARSKEYLVFDGKEYDNAQDLINDVISKKDEMNYWEFKGKRFKKDRDGINQLYASIDNADAKAEVARRITERRNSGAKINPEFMDEVFNRVLVSDFKSVSNPLYSNEMILNLQGSKGLSGDSLKGFARNAKGKGKPKYMSRAEQAEEIITKTVEEPIDASKLVSPANIDYSNVYKGESVKVKPYTEAQLREIRTQRTWSDEKKAEYAAIRKAEEDEAIARYEELVQRRDPSVQNKSQNAWVKENKNRSKSAAFLDENSLAKSEARRAKALDELIEKLEPELADAILEGDGPKMNKAISKAIGKDWNPIDQMIKLNMKGNATVDSYSRLAMYLKAKDDAAFLDNLGVETPMEAVRYALFDPADLSYTEENVLKKLIPFYTFTKKNLVYQMKNLAKHSSKYHRLYKGIRKSWENSGIGWENLPDYQMNQMFIPIPSIDSEGNYNYIRVNLPFSDAMEFAANPLQRTLSSFTPAVRAPFEIATNRQIFTGQPISEYEGQMNKQIPFLDNKSAYALSQFGLDVPVRVATDMAGGLSKMLEDIRGGSAPNPLDFTRGLNLTREGNIYKNQSYETYEELQAVRDYMTKLKDSGTSVPTIEELQSSNPMLDSIRAKLSKYK